MSRLDPQLPIGLRWRPEFTPILDILERRLRSSGLNAQNHLLAWYLLRIAAQGEVDPTPQMVVDDLYRYYAAAQNAVNFDTKVWHDRVSRMVAVLKSDEPRQALEP